MINSLEQAVQSAKMNNPEGQSFLYEHTYKKAYYVALKFMQNEDEAYDVVQDAYMRAFKSISQLDEWNKFESWLNQIVANTAKNALKKKKPDLFTDIAGDEENDVADRFEANYTQQPEVVMDQNETSRLVQEIISELSDEQRACVMMYYIQELSVKEISETLEVSDNTVKSRLNYARKNIEAKVKELEKKGTKLYALAPIPFFLLLLHTEADACEATAGATTATGATAGTASTGAGATAATGAGAAGAGMSLGMKIAIGITAAVVAIGGAIGVSVVAYNSLDNSGMSQEESSTSSSSADLPEQGDFKKYLASQNILYDKDIVVNIEYDEKTLWHEFEIPEGIMGYQVIDVNSDGEDELVVLRSYKNGDITASIVTNGTFKVEEHQEVKLDNIETSFLLTQTNFYTKKVGDKYYLLMEYDTGDSCGWNAGEMALAMYEVDGNEFKEVVNFHLDGSGGLGAPEDGQEYNNELKKVLNLLGATYQEVPIGVNYYEIQHADFDTIMDTLSAINNEYYYNQRDYQTIFYPNGMRAPGRTTAESVTEKGTKYAMGSIPHSTSKITRQASKFDAYY